MVYKNYCSTLYDCFFTTMNNGLRARGGIGEALGSVYRGSVYVIDRIIIILVSYHIRPHVLCYNNDISDEHLIRYNNRFV